MVALVRKPVNEAPDAAAVHRREPRGDEAGEMAREPFDPGCKGQAGAVGEKRLREREKANGGAGAGRAVSLTVSTTYDRLDYAGDVLWQAWAISDAVLKPLLEQMRRCGDARGAWRGSAPATAPSGQLRRGTSLW